MLKFVGAGLAAFTLVLSIVAVAWPMLYYSRVESGGDVATYGFGYYVAWWKMETNGATTECGDDGYPDCTNMLTKTCDEIYPSGTSSDLIDDCDSCLNGVKAGFSFMFLGMLLNLAQMVSFVLPALGDAIDGKMPIVLSAVTGLFYFFGWVCVLACGSWVDKQNESSAIDYGVSFSFIFGIVITLFNLGTCGIAGATMGKTEEESVQVQIENGTAEQNGTAEAEAPPPGGVYQKNGVWYDKDDQPMSDHASAPAAVTADV